jgi:hypothetical protein
MKAILDRHFIPLIAVIYVLVTAGISKIIIINSFWLSCIATPSIFIIPFLIGSLFIFFAKGRNSSFKDIVNIFTAWFAGTLVLLSIALALDLMGSFSAQIFSLVSIILALIGGIVASIKSTASIKTIFCQKSLKVLTLIIIVLFAAFVPLIVFKFSTGFPGNYSLVEYRFTYIGESLVQRNSLVLNQITDKLPIFQTPLAVTSTLYGADTYILDWFMVFLMATFFVGGIYSFLRKVSLGRNYALLGAILSTYILVWNPSYDFPVLHDVQPRTITLIMFPFILSAAIDLSKHQQSKSSMVKILLSLLAASCLFLITYLLVHPELVDRRLIFFPVLFSIIFPLLLTKLGKNSSLTLSFLSFSLILGGLPLTHIYEGAFYIILAGFFILALIIFSKIVKFAWVFTAIFASISLLVLCLIVNNFIQISPNTVLNIPFLPSNSVGFVYNPIVYFNVLVGATSSLIFYLALLGIGLVIFFRHNNVVCLAITSTFILILTTYFLPIPDIVRIGAALAPFLIYLTILTISGIINKFLTYCKKLSNRLSKTKISITKKIGVLLIISVVLFSALIPLHTYIDAKTSLMLDSGSPSSLSLVSNYEYNMASWLRNNVPQDAVIISDPETMYLIAGISGRQPVVSTGLLIGELQIPDQIRLYWIKFNVLCSKNPEETNFFIQTLASGKQPILIISGRTEKWLSQVQFVQAPYSFNSSKVSIFSSIFKNQELRLLKNVDNQIYAFTTSNHSINNPPDYKPFLVNDYPNYDNVTNFSNDWRLSNDEWNLSKQVITGPVATFVYDQYLSAGGSAPVIKWSIPLPENSTYVSVFAYNMMSADSKSVFSFSKNGQNWVNGNFSYPLQYLFTEKPVEGNLTIYGRSIPGQFNRLGTLVFVSWNSRPYIEPYEYGWTKNLIDYINNNITSEERILTFDADNLASFTKGQTISFTDLGFLENATTNNLANVVNLNKIKYVLFDSVSNNFFSKSNTEIGPLVSLNLLVPNSAISSYINNLIEPTNCSVLKLVYADYSNSEFLYQVISNSSLNVNLSLKNTLSSESWIAGDLGKLATTNNTYNLIIGDNKTFTYTYSTNPLKITLDNNSAAFLALNVTEINNARIARVELWSNNNSHIGDLFPPSNNGVWIAQFYPNEIDDIRIVITGNSGSYITISLFSIISFNIKKL